jgi:heme oxygenase
MNKRVSWHHHLVVAFKPDIEDLTVTQALLLAAMDEANKVFPANGRVLAGSLLQRQKAPGQMLY